MFRDPILLSKSFLIYNLRLVLHLQTRLKLVIENRKRPKSNAGEREGGGAEGEANYLGPGLVRGAEILVKRLVMDGCDCQEGWEPVLRNHLLVLRLDLGSRQPCQKVGKCSVSEAKQEKRNQIRVIWPPGGQSRNPVYP